jgi:hypothetical protein
MWPYAHQLILRSAPAAATTVSALSMHAHHHFSRSSEASDADNTDGFRRIRPIRGQTVTRGHQTKPRARPSDASDTQTLSICVEITVTTVLIVPS